jgi:hypothetical protein
MNRAKKLVVAPRIVFPTAPACKKVKISMMVDKRGTRIVIPTAITMMMMMIDGHDDQDK